MNIYDKNISAIKEFRPYLYESVIELEEQVTNSEKISIESIKTKEAEEALIIEVDSKRYRLNSAYFPTEEAKKWVEQFGFNNLGIVVIMFGLGNSIFVKEMLKNMPEDGKLIIYEPSDEISSYVLRSYDLEHILKDKRLYLNIGERKKVNFLEQLAYHIHWTNVKSQIVCKHSQYEKAFMQEYKDFLNDIKENNEKAFINKNTEAFFGKTIVSNTIGNLSCIKHSNTVMEYQEKIPKDVPAIIVSAGPSLDKNIEELKKAKGKAVIIATDTALRHLFKHDIDPDFVVTIDPKKPPEYFANPRCKGIPMFCKMEGNKDVVNEHRGRIILLNTHSYIESMYLQFEKTISRYTSGGSVATAAFSVCAALEFEKIVLIGQDLSYGDGVTHAGGEISNVRAEEYGIRYVEDINGNQIKTRHDWYIYLKWFEKAVKLIPDIDVIDATEGGAKIHGTRIMKLSEVIDQYCSKEVNCIEIVENTPVTFDEEQLNKVKNFISDSLKELDEIIEESSLGISLCNRLIKANSKKKHNNLEYNKMISRLSGINKSIDKKTVNKLIDTYIMDESSAYLENIYQISENSKDDSMITLKSAIEIYEANIRAAKEIKPLIENELMANWS